MESNDSNRIHSFSRHNYISKIVLVSVNKTKNVNYCMYT